MRVAAIGLLQELLVLALQLVVEDHARDATSVGPDVLGLALVGAVHLHVVRELARATQASMEGLPRLVASLEARRLEQLSPIVRERHGALIATIDGDRLH